MISEKKLGEATPPLEVNGEAKETRTPPVEANGVARETGQGQRDVAAAGGLAIAIGPFDECVGQVLDGSRTYPATVKADADAAWEALIAEKPHCFDGPIWSLSSHHVDPSRRRLTLSLQSSTYRYQMYTHFSTKGKKLPMKDRANASGTSAILITTDDRMLLGMRSAKVAICPSTWHLVPAGTVDGPLVLEVVKHELLEETGVRWDQITDCICVGLLDSGEEQGHKPEILWTLRVGLTSEELLRVAYANANDSEDGYDEHTSLACVERDELETFLSNNKVTQVGAASMRLVAANWERMTYPRDRP